MSRLQPSAIALHYCRIRPGRGEGAHVLQVAGRVTPRVRKPLAQVSGEPIDDLGAPALLFLAVQDVPPDRPIGHDQLGADPRGGPLAAGGDPAGDRVEQLGVPPGQPEVAGRGREASVGVRVVDGHLHHRLHLLLGVLDVESARHE